MVYEIFDLTQLDLCKILTNIFYILYNKIRVIVYIQSVTKKLVFFKNYFTEINEFLTIPSLNSHVILTKSSRNLDKYRDNAVTVAVTIL